MWAVVLWIASPGSSSTPGSTGRFGCWWGANDDRAESLPFPQPGLLQPQGPGQGRQALVITGGLEPQNQARYTGQGWAEGPQLSQPPPAHRPCGGVVQKGHGGNCSLPCTHLPAVFSWWLQPLLSCLERASKPPVSPLGVAGMLLLCGTRGLFLPTSPFLGVCRQSATVLGQS